MSLRRSSLIAIAVLATGPSFTAPVEASYSPVHLWKCVRAADVIVAGTVHSITPRDFGAIVSQVQLRELTVLRGGRHPESDSLVIRVLGGWLDGRGTADDEGPKFHERERYILLLRESLGARQDRYTPVVYLNQGMFPVLADSGDTTFSVRDWLRRPIVAVHDGRIVSLRYQRSPSASGGSQALTRVQILDLAARTPPGAPLIEIPRDLDPGTRLTESMFLEDVRRLMEEHSREPSEN